MKKCKRLLAALLSVFMLTAMLVVPTTASAGQTNLRNRVVGYFPSYRYEYVNSIDYSAMTHCILSFITYNNGTMKCSFTDDQIRTIRQKCTENDVKLMIAIGGWGGFNSSDNPIDTAEKRTKFVNDLMYYVNTYDLDGIDIDIEIESSAFWSNFDAVATELKTALNGKLLTMAVSSWFTGAIPNSVYAKCDFINLMSYDYSNSDVAPMSQVYNLISYYSSRGVPDSKMTIGVPFYGYDGSHRDYTYAQIIAMNKDASQLDNYNGISYNGMKTIEAKAEFSLDYGGIMIWEVGQDSFDSNYSLLGTIKRVYDSNASGVAPVTNLKASNTTFNSTELSWTASPDAVSYNIYNGSDLIGSTSGTSYKVTGLTDGTSYTLKVVAVNSAGETSYSVNVSVETPIDSTAIKPWDATATYNKGDQVVYEGKIYEAQWWTQNEIPGKNEWGAWKYVGEASGPVVDPTVPATGIILYYSGTPVVNNGSINVKDTDGSMSFTAAVLPDNATNKNYTITVNNNKVAAVSGNVATVTPANATEDTSVVITATSEDGSYTVKYTVNIDYTEPAPIQEADVFVFKIDDENIYYANNDTKFTAGAAATFDENSRTVVPLRAIAAATGVSDLKYDAATKKITFTGFDGYHVEMQTGSTLCTLTKGSETINLTIVAPFTKDGSTMLPLRDTANLVGGYVKYSDHYIVVSKEAVADEDIPGYIAAYDAK